MTEKSVVQTVVDLVLAYGELREQIGSGKLSKGLDAKPSDLVVQVRREVERLRELLADVANSGVDFDDDRIDWLNVQISRLVWDELSEFRIGDV